MNVLSMSFLCDDPIKNRSLWGISWMCFFWCFASVMVFSLLPTFLTDVLGASKLQLGIIEGISVFLSFAAKVVAGILSDVFKKRRPIILTGTILTIGMKALFALATTSLHIFFARSLDRLIKGWRSAPTDALIADLTPAHKGGLTYGVRQTLYVMGGVFGGIAASLLMTYSGNNYRFVFWCSLIPATLSLAILIFFVCESHDFVIKSKKWSFKDIGELPPLFWILILSTFFLMLARFSTAFLNVRAKECGFSLAMIPLLTSAYELAQALVAWPIGRLADRMNRHLLLVMGTALLTVTNLIVIFFPSGFGIALGMILAGVHLGMTQGLISTLIAQASLQHLRGTTFAIYYTSTGVAVLLGNCIAGQLSELMHSSIGAFIGGAFFTISSVLILVVYMQRKGLFSHHHKPQ